VVIIIGGKAVVVGGQRYEGVIIGVVGEGVGWWWWLVIIVARGWLSSGEEAGWWCHGVVVVGERTCGEVCSGRYGKKVYKKPYFFMSFLSAVGAVLDGGGICRPPGCCRGCPSSWGVSLQVMLVSFRWEGWDLTICTFARIMVVSQGGGGGGVRQ
jgi:hypothetical protein